MKYYTIPPSEKLAAYVRSFWVLEGTINREQPYIHRTLATFCPEMIFHYKGSFEELTFPERPEKSFITGIHSQTTKFRRFIAKENFGIFGVLLEPYAIPALLGIPSTEIVNELPDIITSFLEKRLTAINRLEIINATKIIYSNKGQLNCKELAAYSCLSQRQFERRFKELTGFTPKLFCRLVRFKSLLCSNKNYRSLTEIAYDFGYYDQAHFIQDFREFSGYNPGSYFSGKASEVFNAP
jgi:AraC-like DNA-binding protein